MEKKTTCPTFNGDNHSCFVEVTDEGFESYICFDCGYTSNSALKLNECDEETQNYTSLVKQLKIEDRERGLEWYPSLINMGAMGMIYPEGEPELWYYKVAKVKEIPKDQRKNYPKPDGGYYETFLDVDGAESFSKYEFLDACKSLGITQHVDKSNGKTTI
tara:strand:- start:6190 stop:6669 length:480 start_codon:yes stop_codon:yes gene_type:complete